MYMKNMWDVGRGEQHECDGGVGQGGPRGQHDRQEGGGPTDGQGWDGRVFLLHTCFTHIHTQVSTHVPDIFTLMLTHTILMITYMFIHSCI